MSKVLLNFRCVSLLLKDIYIRDSNDLTPRDIVLANMSRPIISDSSDIPFIE